MKSFPILGAAVLTVAMLAPANAADVNGSLVIVGGGLRFDDLQVWSKIVELAGGKGARIAIFPTASASPQKVGGRIADTFKKVGGDPFVVPLAVKNIDVDYRQAAVDPDLVAQVRASTGVFFTGGEQERITRALRTVDGKNTPLLDAIWEVYRRGGVIAGSSAGAAVMSRVMYRDADMVLPTMQHGVSMGKEIDRGLGFIGDGWFVEQHCLTRGRFARALVVMQSQGFKYGIGVDDNTALVIRGGRDLKVVGYKGAVVMDLSKANHDAKVDGFNLKNVRLTYLDRGDRLDLETLAITPSPEKADGIKLDPNSTDFHPYHDRLFFSNDILGNTAVVDMLAKLINNKRPEAIGMAFDGFFATRQPTRGFEFRFYREKDSIGWCTEAYGGEDYTVSNIHLDIRPVDIAPLYRSGQEELATDASKPAAVVASKVSDKPAAIPVSATKPQRQASDDLATRNPEAR